ncbi:unnamed protein product [Toxocara canis]|uniref:MSP domain-containing protein n=1 Tax=Toxocara canis TaxID=6265 RepID=A0A183V633_TOXCA|nr:unnamed protein product [Toxocara canis]
MFKSIDNRPDAARVQLILCNISDRTVFFRLRCSANAHVSSFFKMSLILFKSAENSKCLIIFRVGYICEREFCTATSPPTTQLLLDAASTLDYTSEEDEDADNGWLKSVFVCSS